MKRSRPGVLSVRAINQYRRRDVLPYLGLRYYLENSAARSDEWAKQVAIDLVLARSNGLYFRVHHFKETTDTGRVEHRAIFLPGANEALAESALLDECANHPQVFSNPICVFSYHLNSGKDRSGIFRHYMDGLRTRQQAIAKACDARPNGVVLYTDIKRFYPSIEADLASRIWQRQSGLGNLSKRYRDLGEKLISEHSRAGNERNILTGPMFSHFLGNLVLREMDEEFSATLPAKYFRYVDDITLVGDQLEVSQSLSTLRSRLRDLGFSLHDKSSPKSIEVSTSEWLTSRNDFYESRRASSWLTLVSDLKHFLLLNPGEREELQNVFRNEGFRIPIRDYSNAVLERGFLERVYSLAQKLWFKSRNQGVSVRSIVSQAKWLRKRYEREFRKLADGIEVLSRFERKRRIPKLRYRAGRLIYLAADDTLGSLHRLADAIPELRFHAKVMDAVGSGNIDQLLPLGTNAAQAAAQTLRAAGKRCNTTLEDFSVPEEQALAIFILNGVSVDRSESTGTVSNLMRFAVSGADINLMKDAEPFIRELACLHGIVGRPRHPELLEAVFDEDEDLAMDAIDQLQQSLSH